MAGPLEPLHRGKAQLLGYGLLLEDLTAGHGPVLADELEDPAGGLRHRRWRRTVHTAPEAHKKWRVLGSEPALPGALRSEPSPQDRAAHDLRLPHLRVVVVCGVEHVKRIAGEDEPLQMFDHAYAELPPYLEEQREELAEEVKATGEQAGERKEGKEEE